LLVAQQQDTFGKKSMRKRPKVVSTDLESLISAAGKQTDDYVEAKDSNIAADVRLASNLLLLLLLFEFGCCCCAIVLITSSLDDDDGGGGGGVGLDQ
jgi:hypothetical protein